MRILLLLAVNFTLLAQPKTPFNPMYGPFSANPKGPIQADGQYPNRTFTPGGVEVKLFFDGLVILPIIDFIDKNELLKDVDAVYLVIHFERQFGDGTTKLFITREVSCPAYPLPVGCDGFRDTTDLASIKYVELKLYHLVKALK